MTLKALVEKRLKETGQSQAAAQRAGGLTRGFLSDILKSKKVNVHGARLTALAKALQVEERVIVDAMRPVSAAAVPTASPDEPVFAGDFEITSHGHRLYDNLPRDLPVYGTAAGSMLGEFEGFSLEIGAIDYVRRPPSLLGVKDAYAIFVTGDSMVPEHRPGDLRFVHPHRPASIGDTVIVIVRNHDHAPLQAFIKVLLKRTPETIVVEQHNPKAQMAFKRSTVLSVHRVLTVAEMFGV